MTRNPRRLRGGPVGATHRSVPRHSGRRPAHARPRPSSDVPAALQRPHPLTPLSERDRRPRPWRGHGRLAAVASAAVIAVVAIPLLGAALTQGAPGLQPLAGGVAGAVSLPNPSSSAPGGDSRIAVDPRLLPARSTDADAPPSVNQRGPTPAAWLTGYRWPISKGRVSLPFKAIPGGELRSTTASLFHDGVDMASFCGAPVGAAHDGVVLAAGRRFDDADRLARRPRAVLPAASTRSTLWSDLPIVVVIDDGNGYRSIYAHFRDVTVRVGQHVKAGQLIGHEGATGHASGCHVHYGLFSPLETKTFGVRADILRRHEAAARTRSPGSIRSSSCPAATSPSGPARSRRRSRPRSATPTSGRHRPRRARAGGALDPSSAGPPAAGSGGRSARRPAAARASGPATAATRRGPRRRAANPSPSRRPAGRRRSRGRSRPGPARRPERRDLVVRPGAGLVLERGPRPRTASAAGAGGSPASPRRRAGVTVPSPGARLRRHGPRRASSGPPGGAARTRRGRRRRRARRPATPSPKIARIDGPKTSARSRSIARTVRWK